MSYTEEECPVILAHGDKIVEVGTVRWGSHDGANWGIVGKTEIVVTGTVSRVIYELPVGCFESPVTAFKGNLLTFNYSLDGGGREATPCNSKPSFVEAPTRITCESGRIKVGISA